MPSQTERNPAINNVSILYVDEIDETDHVSICDRIEKILNEEPRREPSFSDEENKENGGFTPCRRPPAITGDRPAPSSLAKHLAEVAMEVYRRPPVSLSARPSPACPPLQEKTICRRPPARPFTRLDTTGGDEDPCRRPPVLGTPLLPPARVPSELQDD